MEQDSTASAATTVVTSSPAMPRAERRSGGAEYSDTLGCSQCLAKHLSKAAVEALEYFEDEGRESEFALCIGDLACAEDHALALGMAHDRNRIRSFRDRMWSGDKSVRDDILKLASAVVKSYFSKVRDSNG